MSWLFSRALVEAYSAGTCLDGAQSALWNGTPTQRPSWLPAKTTAACRLSRSGMTFKRLTDDLGEDVLTSFLEAFPARTSVQPARAPESTASAQACGDTWRESFARFDRDLCSWKTAQCSFLADLEQYSETWPRWGMMRDGACSELPTPALRIDETECGLLPTPMANERDNKKFMFDKHAKSQSGRSLSSYARTFPQGKAWPTPTVCGNYNRKGLSKTSGDGLATAAKASVGGDETRPKTLNPAWVEWLMGWPIGWTDLHALATDKFQQWQRLHGLSCCDDSTSEPDA